MQLPYVLCQLTFISKSWTSENDHLIFFFKLKWKKCLFSIVWSTKTNTYFLKRIFAKFCNVGGTKASSDFLPVTVEIYLASGPKIAPEQSLLRLTRGERHRPPPHNHTLSLGIRWKTADCFLFFFFFCKEKKKKTKDKNNGELNFCEHLQLLKKGNF